MSMALAKTVNTRCFHYSYSLSLFHFHTRPSIIFWYPIFSLLHFSPLLVLSAPLCSTFPIPIYYVSVSFYFFFPFLYFIRYVLLIYFTSSISNYRFRQFLVPSFRLPTSSVSILSRCTTTFLLLFSFSSTSNLTRMFSISLFNFSFFFFLIHSLILPLLFLL